MTVPAGSRVSALDWPATLIERGPAALAPAHLQRRQVDAHPGALHCFVLDTSASMLRGDGLAQAKGLLMALMRAAAAARQRLALLCFAGQRLEVRVPPTRAGAWRENWITPIGGGGGTTVEPALRRATRLLGRHRRQHPADRRTLWLLTDGRTIEKPVRPDSAERIVIIDFDAGRHALHRTARWARRWRDSGARVDRYAAATLRKHPDALARALADRGGER